MILLGDAPYYARFGFSGDKTGELSLPGPFERDRLLGLELARRCTRRRLGHDRRQLAKPVLEIRAGASAREGTWCPPDARPPEAGLRDRRKALKPRQPCSTTQSRSHAPPPDFHRLASSRRPSATAAP